jgi:hypothetical protein
MSINQYAQAENSAATLALLPSKSRGQTRGSMLIGDALHWSRTAAQCIALRIVRKSAQDTVGRAVQQNGKKKRRGRIFKLPHHRVRKIEWDPNEGANVHT